MKFSIWQCLVCTLLFAFLLNGCGYKEVDKRSFATSIGIDKGSEDHRFKVSVKLAIPQSEAEKVAEEFQLITKEADMLSEAVQQIAAEVEKTLDFGHVKVIVLGEQLKAEDIFVVKDWLQRRRDIQNISFVSLGKPSAEEVLAFKSRGENIPANALILAMDYVGSESQYILTQHLFEFSSKIEETGLDPVLPLIEIKNDTYNINQAVVFKHHHNDMLLSPEETRYLHLLTNGLKEGAFKTEHEETMLMMSIDKAAARISLEADDRALIKVDVKGKVEEQSSPKLIQSADLSKIAESMEEKIKNDLTDLVEKLQDNAVDPLGFGLKYRARHWNSTKTEEEEWKRLYPELKYQINVDVDLKAPAVIR
ncbi:Ger(x)C family spore germination protein [Alkalihalobacillus oceani]|uniref:Ger(X)C family spore germination protein n=1 Tax=Halalkalibacter oceani TaxID=1653776 RepID=A0A9X2DQJ0_9BACI|nr:Ger(x)C family spore germination protein [Halalkalibacter oceani]MCM3713293.1 Ger(x)C family spore germination protein [Halalkalibacter oceani]